MPRADVSAVLDRLGLAYARRGRWYELKCPHPAHPDNSPSFRIHTEDGGFKCWSCKFSGRSLVSLVMGVLGIEDVKEAQAWLDSTKTAPRHVALRSEMVIREARTRGFVLPPGVVVAPVSEWPSPASGYLRERGVPDWQAEAWGLGYAVDGGLSGRIVIPVRDLDGKLVSYTARAFGRARKKYLEPRTEEGADKAAIFGEEQWPFLTERRELLVVVEGAFDGMAIERTTALPFAGLYGSEFVPGHASKLGTWEWLLLITDPDEAGERVAKEIRGQLGRWAKFSRLVLPAGEDCASLAKVDPSRLRAMIDACLTDTLRSASPVG